jgi:uncharacterized protein (TIGR00730 family)
LVREMIGTTLRLARQGANRGDLKILNTTLKELRHAFGVFARYRHVRKITLFGSARLAPSTPEYRAAHDFAEKMAARGFMVITGGAAGLMQAGNEGAGRDHSFGVNIRLPFEQGANPVLEGDEKLLWFKYFFTRKLIFVKESDAIALFPGGFGTHDEGFEALTLTQTGKNHPMPILLVDAPGGTYWKAWDAFVRGEIIRRGLASPEDSALYKITDDVDAAVEEVATFFKNYHSSRFVGERFVIRVTRPVPKAALAALNAEFGDIVTGGAIETSGALVGEKDEASVASLPRLVFQFDRRHFARLRQLIDRLNTLY